MRTTALGALALAAAVAVPAAASGTSTGPYVGSVRENEYRLHRYDNFPRDGRPCPDIVTDYTVTLTALTPNASLQLAVSGEVADTEAGVAAVTVAHGICTVFDIRVAGVAVGGTATYVVSVVRDSPLP